MSEILLLSVSVSVSVEHGLLERHPAYRRNNLDRQARLQCCRTRVFSAQGEAAVLLEVALLGPRMRRELRPLSLHNSG